MAVKLHIRHNQTDHLHFFKHLGLGISFYESTKKSYINVKFLLSCGYCVNIVFFKFSYVVVGFIHIFEVKYNLSLFKKVFILIFTRKNDQSIAGEGPKYSALEIIRNFCMINMWGLIAKNSWDFSDYLKFSNKWDLSHWLNIKTVTVKTESQGRRVKTSGRRLNVMLSCNILTSS